MRRRHEGGLLTTLATGMLVALSTMGACDGGEFSGSATDAGAGGEPETSAGGGPSSQGGAMSSAGESSSEAGEASEQGGAAGAAGSGSCEVNADCAAGRFCRQGSCVSCGPIDDLAALEYGNPEALDAINDTLELEGVRFARPTGVGLGLVYARDFFGAHLWFTSDFSQSAGIELPGPASTYQNSGLRVTFALPPELSAYDFFFQRSVADDAVTKTTLYGAKLDGDGVLTGVAPLPAPFNQPNVAASYSLALAKQRAVWTQNVDGSLGIHLRTIGLPVEDQEPADLLVPLPFDCGFANELEYAPWLTPDGKTLFFSARVATAECLFMLDTPTALYVVGLSNAGEPLGPARMLTGLGPEGSFQTDAALSADGCHLFYSSRADANMMLYRAERRN